MRSAPFGLIPHIASDAVYKLSADAASLTHGHPSARQSAGGFSLLIHRLVSGRQPGGGRAGGRPARRSDADAAPELRERLAAALRLPARRRAEAGLLQPGGTGQQLGEGWVAEEAFAVGLYAVLATAPGAGDAIRAARRKTTSGPPIALAVNHSGDSDSTGSIAGNILGAYYGEECLPADWLEALEAPRRHPRHGRHAGGRYNRLRDTLLQASQTSSGIRPRRCRKPEDDAAQAESGEGLQRGSHDEDRQHNPGGRGAAPATNRISAVVDTTVPMPWANRLGGPGTSLRGPAGARGP